MLAMLFLIPVTLRAQNVAVSGVVTGSDNTPLDGATVVVRNGSAGTVTDANGSYTISVPADATLIFQYAGLVPVEERINGRTRINVTLSENENILDDIVVVGYGIQRRGSITGAVSNVKGDQMIKTVNENPQNMLTGRVAGVRVWQKSAEPGSFNATLDVRGLGSPLVIIDGVPREMSDYQRLNPADIEDVSVLKDAAASIYGLRSANGVLLVTTKKGQTGKAQVSYNGSFTFQVPSRMPELANPEQTMTLYNERERNIDRPTSVVYDKAAFEKYRNGETPTADWNALVFANWSPQTQHDLSVTGGTDKTKYYVGLGYMYQEGLFKSGDLNYNRFNLRSNISTRIAKGLTFELNVAGMAEQRNYPYSSSSDIIRNYWRQGVLHAAYADPEQTMLSYAGLDLDENTIAKMTADVSGFRKYEQKTFQTAATLNYDLGSLTDVLTGLSAKAMFSYDYKMDNNHIFRKEYTLYAYDELTSSYLQRIYSSSSPSQMRREFYDRQQTLGFLSLNYDRAFGKHKVGALLGWEVQRIKGDNFYAQNNLVYASPYLLAGSGEPDNQLAGMNASGLFEQAYGALIGRLNYSYDDRYLLEAQFRYDGSSLFYTGHKWFFLPSVSAGWRISEEPFFKNAPGLSFINQIKLRASYGVLGDDAGMTYQWAMGYTYPAVGSGDANKGFYNGYVPGYVFDGSFNKAVTPLPLPYYDVTWYKSHTFNIGIEFEAWNGLLGVGIDYFDRHRTGLFGRPQSETPTVLGADLPQLNLNSDRHFGMELELSHRNRVGDFSYRMKGIVTITRRQYLKRAEAGPYGNSYDKWRNDNYTNRYQGVQFGYEGAGRFTSWEDIRSYPLYKERDVLPGDYKYVDWNGDGEIGGLDEHPFAFDQTPWMNFSLSFDASYKNFDLSMLFQGSALGSLIYQEPLYSIWGSNGGGALEMYLDRWHPADPDADIYDPDIEWISGKRAYTGRSPRENSSFNRVSTAYLRLKSIELGYTIPRIKALSSMNLRVFANAYNLFTITGVNFVDPERPDDDYGRLYPLNRTYTLGLSLTF